MLQRGSSSFPINRDSLVLWTKLFDPLIRKVKARPALYMVWPASDRIFAFDDVRLSYQTAATADGGMFIPAGAACTIAWASDSSIALCAADGLHPTPTATHLVAPVMYERITGHDARNLPARAIANGIDLRLPDTTVRVLQRAARDANAKYAPYWRSPAWVRR